MVDKKNELKRERHDIIVGGNRDEKRKKLEQSDKTDRVVRKV
jgi:hypothetical protein